MTWRYVEPQDPQNNNWDPREIVLTENEILQQTYPGWARRAMEFNRTHTRQIPIMPAACIEDWVVVNWAERVK